ETIARQGRIMVDAGATGVHIMDSAGALTMDDVKARIAAMLAEFGGDAEAGIHAHQNLSLAVANTIVAFQEGATLADACLAGAGDVLVEVGRRKSVGGQEDLVIEVAARLAAPPAAS